MRAIYLTLIVCIALFCNAEPSVEQFIVEDLKLDNSQGSLETTKQSVEQTLELTKNEVAPLNDPFDVDPEEMEELSILEREFYWGTNASEVIIASEDNDMLYGNGGNDTIVAGNGDNLISGGQGIDHLIGGDGNDLIYGGPDSDTIYGGDGDDQLYGDAGSDYLDGQDGDDYLDGGADYDSLVGGTGNDVMYGGSAHDIMIGQDGNDFLDGGIDNDYLEGDCGADSMFGGLDEDSLIGGDDNDILYGEAGDDDLRGGYGNDYLVGGPDNDFLSGDAYPDSYEFTGFFGQDRIYIGVEYDYPGIAIFTAANPTVLLFRQNGSDLVISRHYSQEESFFPYYDSVTCLAWFDDSFLREVHLFYTVGDPVYENLYTIELTTTQLVQDMSVIPWSEDLSTEDLMTDFWDDHSIYTYYYCLDPSNCHNPATRQVPEQKASIEEFTSQTEEIVELRSETEPLVELSIDDSEIPELILLPEEMEQKSDQ